MKNVVVPVKMTEELKARIDELAQKGMTNRNHWIIRTLTRNAYKHQTDKPNVPCDKTPQKNKYRLASPLKHRRLLVDKPNIKE